MKDDRPLVDEIEAFLRESGMGEKTFGHKVQREWRLVDRLRAGGDVTTRTAEKIRTFIADHRTQESQSTKRQSTSLRAYFQSFCSRQRNRPHQ